MPRVYQRLEQMTFDGKSLLDSLTRCEGGEPRTQYFEVGGKAGLYSQGWMLSIDNNDGWHPGPDSKGSAISDPKAWKLYDLTSDFSQSEDVSAQHPERRDALFALWQREAERNNVLPIRTGFTPSAPSSEARAHYDFWGKDVSIPAHPDGLMGRQLNQSFTLKAELELDRPAASGVVMALGSRFAGWSLFLEDGRPVFVFARSIRPQDVTRIAADAELKEGTANLELRVRTEGPGKAAHAVILADGKPLASGEIPSSFHLPLGVGEQFDAGRDTGVPVAKYKTAEGTIEGDIRHISIAYE